MTIINTYNYEEYMIDFMEGNLSPTLTKEMEGFLVLNPEIKNELEGLDETVLYDDEVSFYAKESLYKDTDASAFEDKCVSYIENELKGEEKNIFELETSLDSGKKSLLDDYKKTIIFADESIVFTNKESLKRYFPYRLKKLIHFASAALVIFAISLSILLLPSEFVDTNQLSENSKVFSLPKKSVTNEIRKDTKRDIKEDALVVRVNKPMLKMKNIASPISITKKTEIKRIPLLLTTNKIRNTVIINEVKIANADISDEIIIHERLTVSEEVIREMSNELALNNSASEWKIEEDIQVKDKKISSNNIFVGGKKKLKTIIGKFFYKKEIRYSKENKSTDK